MEADFLAIYHIADPLGLPSAKFFNLAERLVFYAGATRGRYEMEANAEAQSKTNRRLPGQPQKDQHVESSKAAIASNSDLNSLIEFE